jgi:hypothetical protein
MQAWALCSCHPTASGSGRFTSVFIRAPEELELYPLSLRPNRASVTAELQAPNIRKSHRLILGVGLPFSGSRNRSRAAEQRAERVPY